jgi:hypothetical protein
LLRPDTALKYLPKDEEKEELKIKESIPEEETKESEEPKEFRDKGVKKLRDIKIEAKLDWQNWDNFYREVIDPLVEENADIEIKLLLIASSKDGIKKDTVDLRIIESLNQRGIKWKFVNES